MLTQVAVCAGTLAIIMAATGCGSSPKEDAVSRPPIVALPVVPTAAASALPSATSSSRPPPSNHDSVPTLSLAGDSPVPVPQSELTVHISESFHKIRAPLVGVSVLSVQAGNPAKKAQVGWRIESGKIDPTWRKLEGRRYDEDSGEYVEERIPGWRVRLDSIDDQSAGGSPTAITISVKRAPGSSSSELQQRARAVGQISALAG